MERITRWSALFLILVFASGGLALTCYSCSWDVVTGRDENCVSVVPGQTETEECDGSDDECELSVVYALYKPTNVQRKCSNSCQESNHVYLGNGVETKCCDTHLCNSQDSATGVALSTSVVAMTTVTTMLLSM
ncbi:prostate stem cell antigen-like [Ptychodera flava]|uniref:prostate stem cell antigen-like n=1 Tax=Ptychodera flava TaxID=63121 RepID=UPI00396AA270